jgi:hypothetical protein
MMVFEYGTSTLLLSSALTRAKKFFAICWWGL